MELDSDDDIHALKADEKDLFAASVELGADVEEYDAENDTFVKRFKRGEDWRDAVNAIRKILKKYHIHASQPARVWISESRVVQSKFIPLLERYTTDRDMYYNIGKILVFLTVPPASKAGTVLVSHQQMIRDIVAAMTKSAIVIPAFLALLEPALDTSKSEKSEQDVNAVDLVLTLFKQMLEVPNGNADDIAGVLEHLVHRFDEFKVFETVKALAMVIERRDFKRLAVVLLDFLFQLCRGQDSDALYKAYTKNHRVQLFAKRSRNDLGELTAPSSASKAVNSRGDDSLRHILKAERRAKEATDLSHTRHSRFGTHVTVNFMGQKRHLSRIADVVIPDVHSTAMQRLHPGRKIMSRKQKEAEVLPLNDGIGSCAVDVSGHSSVTHASELIIGSARRIVVEFFLSLLQMQTHAAEAEDLVSAFGTFSDVVKNKIARDNDDLNPYDVLKYLYITGQLLGIHRLHEVARVDREISDLQKRREMGFVKGINSDVVLNVLDRWSVARLVQTIDSQLLRKQWQLLDVLSAHTSELFMFINALITHGMDTNCVYNDETGTIMAAKVETTDSYQLGLTLVDQLLRDEDLMELVPKMLRMWQPGKFSDVYVQFAMQAAHYSLKLSEMTGMDPVISADPAKPKQRNAAADKYAANFAHPAVIQAGVSLLRNYRRISPKQAYFVVQLFDRLAALPNEYAGFHPHTIKPLTFRVLLYQVTVIQLAAHIVNDRTISDRKEYAELRAWAKRFSAHFLHDCVENPLLFVEALFWRSEKTANADVARHYGLLDGNTAKVTDDGHYAPAVQEGKAAAATRITKSAQEKNDAEAEARRNALAKDADDADGEAVFDINMDDDNNGKDDDDFTGFKTSKGARRKKTRGLIKRRRFSKAARSSSSSSSSDSSSSDSSKSSAKNTTANDGAGGPLIGPMRTSPSSSPAAAKRQTSNSDSDSSSSKSTNASPVSAKPAAVTTKRKLMKSIRATKYDSSDGDETETEAATSSARNNKTLSAAGNNAAHRRAPRVLDDSD